MKCAIHNDNGVHIRSYLAALKAPPSEWERTADFSLLAHFIPASLFNNHLNDLIILMAASSAIEFE